jgi:hypothetical protein
MPRADQCRPELRAGRTQQEYACAGRCCTARNSGFGVIYRSLPGAADADPGPRKTSSSTTAKSRCHMRSMADAGARNRAASSGNSSERARVIGVRCFVAAPSGAGRQPGRVARRSSGQRRTWRIRQRRVLAQRRRDFATDDLGGNSGKPRLSPRSSASGRVGHT